nr:immunoglobulin heavy chain junction region [Homo sapiens]
CARLPAGYW